MWDSILSINVCVYVFVLFVNANFAVSQGIVNFGSNITLSSGAYVYVDGDGNGDYLTNTDGKIDLQNGSDFTLEGDWTNSNASANPIIATTTTGWVRFEGNTVGTQTVNGNSTTFAYLEFNNTNGITLNVNTKTAGKLELTAGAVSTGTNILEMTSSSAADLTVFRADASDTKGFVFSTGTGGFQRAFASNTNTYTFPVGKGTSSTSFFRADILNNSLAGVSSITAKAFSITESGNNIDSRVNTTQNGTPIVEATGETIIWDITPNASPSGGNYGVRLYVDNIAGLSDDKFTPLKRPSGSSDYNTWDAIAGTTTPANGSPGKTVASKYAEKTAITSFSEFSIGKSVNPLPVELLSFNAECKHNSVLLEWETGSESNNDYFTIEKSCDGINYLPLANIKGAGTSSFINKYSYIDAEKKSDYTCYYRLLQTDYDGTEKEIGLVKANCNNSNESNIISIYPNPTRNVISVSYNIKTSGNSYIEVIDILGRTLIKEQIGTDNIYGTKQLNMFEFANGIYYLVIGSEQDSFTEKIIKTE